MANTTFPKVCFLVDNNWSVDLKSCCRSWPLVGDAQTVVMIDFHTGLGKSGTYALLVDAEAGSSDHIRLHEHYGDRIQPWSADHGVAYKIRGGLPEAVVQQLGNPTQVMTCEFGTLPGLKVLQALRSENQSHHWGGQVDADKQRLLNSFKPPSKQWESAVLERRIIRDRTGAGATPLLTEAIISHSRSRSAT